MGQVTLSKAYRLIVSGWMYVRLPIMHLPLSSFAQVSICLKSVCPKIIVLTIFKILNFKMKNVFHLTYLSDVIGNYISKTRDKKEDKKKIQWKIGRHLNLCYLFFSTMWPMLLDISKEECKRILRRMELEAYSSIVSAFRAQGDLTKDKKKILQDLQSTLR